MTIEDELEEATALLRLWAEENREPYTATADFLSRAPLQPAVPTARVVVRSDGWYGIPQPPTDLDHTRCTPASGRLLGMSPIPRPAETEPSGELVELRAWVAKAEAMTADLDPPDMLVHWVHDRKRAESAEAQLAAVNERIRELEALLNTPQVADWARAVQLEAGHQRDRWGSEHDAGKTPADWFWLLGYLGGKALHSATSGNTEKALHHTISAGAALANWHLSLTGADTSMRPGIAEPLTAPSPGEGKETL